MLAKRLIVCLDVRAGKVTKGVKFLENRDLGDPVEMGAEYFRQGVDELVFYDITASAEDRGIDLELVRRVAREVFIPFCVGGGIRHLQDMRDVLLAGAEKVSVNSLAVRHPEIISEGAKAFGFVVVEEVLDEVVDTAAARATAQTGPEFGQIVYAAGCKHLDLAFLGVADPAAQVEFAGFTVDKPAKAYPLHASLN